MFALRSSIVASLMLALVGVTEVDAEPFVPTDDEEVLERLPASRLVSAAADRRATLAGDPRNLDLAVELATDYVRLGRNEGDPRFDGYAEAVLSPWWQLEQPPSQVLFLKATLAQRRHDFVSALADLDQLLARSPGDPRALLTKATILAVRGQPRRALVTCARLPRSISAVIRAACRAGSALGLAEGGNSQPALQRALATEPAAPEVRVWALTILAEGAVMRGDERAAETHFRDALAEGVRDPYLLGAYADLLLDQDRAAWVLQLLRGETRIDPLLLRLAIAGRRLAIEDWPQQVEVLRAHVDTARRRGDRVHLREQARFALELLDDPEQALDLALQNWDAQREPWDARLVLEAAHATERPEAARPVLEWLRRIGLRDVRLDPLVRALEGTVS